MGWIATETRTRLLAQLARLEAQIEAASDTMDSLAAQEIESYRLDTGEGSQQAKRWDATRLDSLIARLERRAEHIRQRLAGMGVTTLNVRRKDDM